MVPHLLRPFVKSRPGRLLLPSALGGASGGYVAGSAPMVEWLRQKARPYLFSNTLAPVIAAVSLGVLDLVEKAGPFREARTRLADVVRKVALR